RSDAALASGQTSPPGVEIEPAGGQIRRGAAAIFDQQLLPGPLRFARLVQTADREPPLALRITRQDLPAVERAGDLAPLANLPHGIPGQWAGEGQVGFAQFGE